MKNFSTILLAMFVAMFWVFRMIVALTAQLGIDFAGVTPFDMNTEVILLFVVLLCLIFIVKRKMIGALIYLISYGLYFGTFLINNLTSIISGGLGLENALNAFVSIIGIALPIAVLLDLLLDKNRKAHPVDKKTDWFYKNEQYDRQLDERADKNNYRTL
ncbi:MAG: hypothetical protein IKF17_05075 [Clostridia bacterium]|nr:hypothetical protein [Clostridia bacterium]